MTESSDFQYVREVDFVAASQAGPEERVAQKLLGSTNGANACSVTYAQTPAGGGSPRGLHYHDFEQIFYIASGVMNFQILDEQFQVGAGGLVVIPAGAPHRNWNESSDVVVHLNIESPVVGAGAERAHKVDQ